MTQNGFHLAGCLIVDNRPLDNRSRPRTAVLIPCFNAEKVLPRALASLAASTEAHDVVLVDDGSTLPLHEALVPAPKNSVIIRLSKNAGITAALNIGLSLIAADGYEYAARLDADDWCTEDRLSKQVSFLDTNRCVSLLGTWARTVDERGRRLFDNRPSPDSRMLSRSLAYRNPIVHSSFMLRVANVIASGSYNNSFRKAEDYELIRRLNVSGAVAVLPEVLTYFQVSSGSISSKRLSQVAADLRVKLLYFALLDPHSYLGLLKTALSVLLPRWTIVALRRQAQALNITSGHFR